MPGTGARNNFIRVNLKNMEFEVHLALRRFSTNETLEMGAKIFPEATESLMRFSILSETWVPKFKDDGTETSDDRELVKAKFFLHDYYDRIWGMFDVLDISDESGSDAGSDAGD